MTRQQEALAKFASKILKPRPILTGSQWANKHFYLSPESSSIPGKVTLYPYQEELMDVMCDYTTPFVVFEKPTRVGFTKLLNMAQAYFIHQRPSSILHAQPNDDEIRGYATDEFEPMVRDNKTIRDLIETPNLTGKAKKEKTLKKLYPGGIWEGVGAQSERNFNRRTVRVFMADEIDTWVAEAGKAGDTLTTGIRRTSDFWDRKNIMGGKPIIKETSKVVHWFEQGDQRYRHLRCPHCKELNLWEFEDFVWDKEYDTDGNVIKHLPDTVHVVCQACNAKITHADYRWMDKHGEWIAHAPENEGIASFHLWAMYSYSPNVTWTDIVKEFLIAKDHPLKLKAFTNEVLARAWEEDFEEVEIEEHEDRLEEYAAEVPKEVLVLTAGVDTQDNRLEIEVKGWGRFEESWGIAYKVFHGDTSKPFVWQRAGEFLFGSKFIHESGGMMQIHATGVDTGGHSTKQAYDFCRENKYRRVFALKGHRAIDAPVVPLKPSFNEKANVDLMMIGVNEAKNVIYSYLMTQEPGAGFMHFPKGGENYNAEYFKQLTAERRKDDGRWVANRKRNEALDVTVYALAALLLTDVDLELLYLNGGMFWQPPAPVAQKFNNPTANYMDEF